VLAATLTKIRHLRARTPHGWARHTPERQSRATTSMTSIPTPRNVRDVGECIYCGARDVPLRREHAVPYGINGPWTLLRASCDNCAQITHKFERDALRSLWPAVRNVLGMQTRRPRERSSTLPLVVSREGTRETVQVSRAEYPIYLPTPLFPAPGIVCGRPLRQGVFTNIEMLHIAGPSFKEAGVRFPGAEFVGINTNFSPTDFARTIAKIALCGAVYALGPVFDGSPIRNVDLGTEPHIGHWVGCWEGTELNKPSGLHAMQIRCSSGTEVHVVLRLFAQFGAPEYHVVLGNVAPAVAASPQWPWQPTDAESAGANLINTSGADD
jgi:hypothetical protein